MTLSGICARASSMKLRPLQCIGITTSGSSFFDLGDDLLEVVGLRRAQMEAADDGVHLLDAGHLLRLPHRVDDADMTAGTDDDQALASQVEAGGVARGCARASGTIWLRCVGLGQRDGIVLGDARLTLMASPDRYDLIMIDAFSSDAIPTHLLTREAFAGYRARLSPNGVLAMHVSNRHMELASVVAAVGAEEGLVAYFRQDDQANNFLKDYRANAEVVVLAQSVAALGDLPQRYGWKKISPRRDVPAWTERLFRRARCDPAEEIRPLASEASQPEARDVVPGRAFGREVAEDFADHRRELEAVAGAGRRDDHVRPRRAACR